MSGRGFQYIRQQELALAQRGRNPFRFGQSCSR